jgi:putative transposase
MALLNIIAQLLVDAARFAALQLHSTRSVEVENLFLRRQLSLFKERGIKPQRVDAASRLSLAVLARCVGCRSTQDHPTLAACRLAPVLALEMSLWQTKNPC